MRLLFEIDMKDYDIHGRIFARPSVRGIILCGEKIAMVHSRKYDYYKFPGGGIEAGETQLEALAREVREEAGLVVRPETIRPYGYVHRIQKSDHGGVFLQDNYYYFCETEPEPLSQRLDSYEADEGYTLEWIDPRKAIAANRAPDHGPVNPVMIEREALVLELLLQEGLLNV